MKERTEKQCEANCADLLKH